MEAVITITWSASLVVVGAVFIGYIVYVMYKLTQP